MVEEKIMKKNTLIVKILILSIVMLKAENAFSMEAWSLIVKTFHHICKVYSTEESNNMLKNTSLKAIEKTKKHANDIIPVEGMNDDDDDDDNKCLLRIARPGNREAISKRLEEAKKREAEKKEKKEKEKKKTLKDCFENMMAEQ